MKTNFERSLIRVLDKVKSGALTTEQAFIIVDMKINTNNRTKLRNRFILGFFAGITFLMFFLLYFG